MDFNEAFSLVIGNEGGYSDNKSDPGGETMFGITRRVAQAWGYRGDMKLLTIGEAKAIAKNYYWDKYKCDQFDPIIGFNIFDAAYNGGDAAKWLQAAAGVTQDGIIGASTITAVRSKGVMLIVSLFNASRLFYYTSLSSEWPEFGRGWVRRIAKNLQASAQS